MARSLMVSRTLYQPALAGCGARPRARRSCAAPHGIYGCELRSVSISSKKQHSALPGLNCLGLTTRWSFQSTLKNSFA